MVVLVAESKAVEADRSELSSASGVGSEETPRRSEDTLQAEINQTLELEQDCNAPVQADVCPRKQEARVQPKAPAPEKITLAAVVASPPPSAHPEGLLRHARVPLIRKGDAVAASRQIAINGIPLAGIMFLDLANSADFPANVFNETNPVPTFAIILMTIGATFALVISVFALVDARRSWVSIKLLRAERTALVARQAHSDPSPDKEKGPSHVPSHSPDFNASLATFLHLNRRDLGTEFFERFGLELFMGVAALLVAAGTYLAIGGDDDRVFMASNLLSGYIGNFPATFYGLINAGWSVIIYGRARRQYAAASRIHGSRHAQRALRRRAWLLQVHGAIGGFSCLVSGALGMVTPTNWQPYPVLAVLGIGFAYTTYLFRTKIGYVRAPLGDVGADVTTADLVAELDLLFDMRGRLLAESTRAARKAARRSIQDETSEYYKQRLSANLQDIVLSGSFDKYVSLLLSGKDRKSTRFECLDHLKSWIELREITALTPQDLLWITTWMHDDGGHHPQSNQSRRALYKALNELWERDMRSIVLKRASMRTRFLTELLGSHLISFPEDVGVQREKTPV